jgi:hypothetical protein
LKGWYLLRGIRALEHGAVLVVWRGDIFQGIRDSY